MFKDMRRKDKEVFDEEITEILTNGEYGVFSSINENGYPYGVPVNYVYHDNCIYFHCANDGHKLHNIKTNNNVSFCVVSDTKIIPEKFSTKYKSVIAFGKASEVIDESKGLVLLKIIEKYSNDYIESGKKYIEKSKDNTKIIKIDIDHMSGKISK